MNEPAPNVPVKSNKRFYILIGVLVVGIALLKLSFLFFFVGMLPAIVAYVVDHDRRKYIFSTVAALNFAGVFPDMMDIFMHGGSFDLVKTKMSDAVIWFVMYGAAGLGWLLVWVSPLVAAAALEGVYRGRIMHLESLQKRLAEDWGADVTRHSK